MLPILTLVLQFVLQLQMPESSLFLMKNGKDLPAAEKSIEFYAGKSNIKAEIEHLNHVCGSTTPSMNVLRALRIKSLRIPLVLALAIGTAKACSGFQVLRSYSTHMFQEAGLHDFLSRYASVILLAEATFSALAVTYLAEKWGRRVLLMSSIWAICILFLLAMLFSIIEETFEVDYLNALASLNESLAGNITLEAAHLPQEMQWPSFMVAILLWIWPILNSIGIGSLGQFVTVEVFPYDYRPMGQALAVQSTYIIGMIITFFYLPLQMAIGSYTYLVLFIIPLAGSGIILQIYFPETKDKCINVVNPNNEPEPQLLTYMKTERL